jgi:hypothetical protein
VQNKKSTDALSDDLFINPNPFGNKVKAIDAPEKKSCQFKLTTLLFWKNILVSRTSV